MKKTKIIAIGGGSVAVPCAPASTLAIDEEAILLAASELPVGRETVNVLFIPTASKDDLWYCHGIYTHFHLRLGCNYDHLRLLGRVPRLGVIAEKIAWADIIYVGGGNTRDMMNVWRITGVSAMLGRAHKEGKVLMGLSAGSICWFEAGLSDSNKFDGDAHWKPMWVSGLGFVPLLNSPHINSEQWRTRELARLLKVGGLMKPVVALEDNAAMEVVGGRYRIINSVTGRGAYLYRGTTRFRLAAGEEFRPLELLM
ncbi:MAG: hypothetical protein A3I44_04085 [Candidatus Sungbacteria bacterium RIFCSPLOWO2_02_FULL_51_17]|uniref:Peptidase E n=1 Tax=Candidatus Sungbacteria bacterium RIFCSPHIGHO2_02_FULL_51_29 TaxID=1802273 RepID=A0A1G2KS96_9BACT|nr:MAG: hypothetical protein A2676_02600 [Candidatus Sungbacteria bacterium RIFCSPHIGHO2_01_FULL_51_22]OHA02223.1 MAG: hypothetical protein A3C16_03930 [Candidatus Sungbacteria bacterium RIFCSPHIGHO2_02_FULL_51_29]OHA06048.1 MAG: hypothetical protein A3B29_05235 [Candidatus Sungbacteria bacterium RIFCSPLOWO2_01_FULL_51_34]OHA11260.1 MAG: hypothetical protein A3I44_04085 [Candidatus Sungbacteria bacterium RIFCSPLOWO2_02_FULL_51_17]